MKKRELMYFFGSTKWRSHLNNDKLNMFLFGGALFLLKDLSITLGELAGDGLTSVAMKVFKKKEEP